MVAAARRSAVISDRPHDEASLVDALAKGSTCLACRHVLQRAPCETQMGKW
jgi:hypothetical protein